MIPLLEEVLADELLQTLARARPCGAGISAVCGIGRPSGCLKEGGDGEPVGDGAHHGGGLGAGVDEPEEAVLAERRDVFPAA